MAELHREFVHAGSDVVEAFTYYAHREKLRLIGAEHLLEPMNRQALAIAGGWRARPARCSPATSATPTSTSDDAASRRTVRAMFDEQVAWAAEAGVDFVIAETFQFAGEALLATEAIRAAGLEAVVTLAIHQEPLTREGWTPDEACRRLADAGAAVVGLNCIRGPRTMLPLLRDIRAAVDAPVAALPVPYRTHAAEPTFQSLTDPDAPAAGGRPFPTALDPFTCSRYDVADVRARGAGRSASSTSACAAAPRRTTSGRWRRRWAARPPASRYSPDMSKHAYLGSDPSLQEANLAFAERL